MPCLLALALCRFASVKDLKQQSGASMAINRILSDMSGFHPEDDEERELGKLEGYFDDEEDEEGGEDEGEEGEDGDDQEGDADEDGDDEDDDEEDGEDEEEGEGEQGTEGEEDAQGERPRSRSLLLHVQPVPRGREAVEAAALPIRPLPRQHQRRHGVLKPPVAASQQQPSPHMYCTANAQSRVQGKTMGMAVVNILVLHKVGVYIHLWLYRASINTAVSNDGAVGSMPGRAVP